MGYYFLTLEVSFPRGQVLVFIKDGLRYSAGSYIKLSGIHGGWCRFEMNISIATHQIFINLVSV